MAERTRSGGRNRSRTDDPATRRETILVFEGYDADGAEYAFEVDGGSVEPSRHDGATIGDDVRTVSGESGAARTAVSGTVTDYKDAWAFDGSLEYVEVDGAVTVRFE